MDVDWRLKFELPEMLFLFVQLAPSTQLGNFVGLRAAQMAALKLPKVGYAVAVDIGDLGSPMGSIHPRRKQAIQNEHTCLLHSIQLHPCRLFNVFETDFN